MASSGNPIPSNKPTGQQIHKINTGLVIGARLIHMEIWIEWAVVHSVNQCRQTKRIKFSQLKTYKLQSKTKMISLKRRIPWIWRIRINRKLRASRKTSTFSNQKKFKTTFNRVPKAGSKCWPNLSNQAMYQTYNWKYWALHTSRRISRWW